MNADLLLGFYLGDFLVEPLRGRITGGSDPAHLPPKAVEVLVCLARQPGELVTRESLLDEVWGADHVSQAALSHAVSDIRHALGDHPEDPHFLQTLPKRGYRLLVAPEPVTETTSSIVIGANNGVRRSDIGLLENLNQRGVLETGLAYLILGWPLIQVADIVFKQLQIPQWAGTFVTALVIAGFPIALIVSWFIEFRDGRAVLHVLSPADARRRRFSRTYVSVLSSLVMAAVIVIIYDRSIGLPQPEPPPAPVTENYLPPIEENSIGVLPFLALDSSEETRILSRAIAEDVIDSLARVQGLFVASRGDSFTLDPNSASQRVRDRLRVAVYVEGSVQIDGNAMRVVVQLIDSASGFHVLSRTFERELRDYFAMRDEIAELAVANVRVALPPETRATPTSVAGDPELGVYLSYRRGIEASRQADVKDRIDEALQWYDAALDVDPGYAAAHAGKCDIYVKAYVWKYDPAYIDAAEQACARALALNPNLDVVYASLGDLHTATGRLDSAENAFLDALVIDPRNATALIGLGEVYRRQQRPDDAEESLRSAIGLHPGDWSAYNALGTYLYRSGRFSEAAEQFRIMVALDDTNVRGHTNLATALVLAEDFEAAEPEFRRALELEPSSITYSNFGLLLYNLGRYDEAVAAHQQAIELEGMDYTALSNYGDALWAAGSRTQSRAAFVQAEELAVKALEVNPSDGFILMDLAWIKTSLGKREEARQLIDRALQMVPDDPYLHYYHGLILNRHGEAADALGALETAVNLGYSTRLLSIDPYLANLREDKKFQELIRPSK